MWSEASNANQTQGTWYSYDDLGNLTRQVTGNDSSATASSGDRTATDAVYDADGMRVLRRVTTHKGKKAEVTATTVFLGDTEITLEEAKRTITRSYTTPGGVPVASEQVDPQGVTSWTLLAADQQHNIRMLRDKGGVKRTSYLPYGTPLGYGNNPALAPGGRGFLNKTHDSNGDVRLDQRNYTPALNVLTTPDPLLSPYDPQSLNPYAYARNNPITFSDPSGLSPCRNPGDEMDAGCHHQDPASPGHGSPTVPGGTGGGSSAASGASETIYAPMVSELSQSNDLDKLSFLQLDQMAGLLGHDEPFIWDGMPICWGQGQCSLAADHALRHPGDYEGILTVGLSSCGSACQDAESHRALGTFLLSLGFGAGGALTSLGARTRASRTTTRVADDAFEHGYTYHPRIRERGLQDPRAHNFPYSFDDVILRTKPVTQSDGSLLYRKPGEVNGRPGVYEIALNPDTGIIFHRTWRRRP